jgi:hypothetical protein
MGMRTSISLGFGTMLVFTAGRRHSIQPRRRCCYPTAPRV